MNLNMNTCEVPVLVEMGRSLESVQLKDTPVMGICHFYKIECDLTAEPVQCSGFFPFLSSR